MMLSNQRIVYTKEDGTVAVIQPAPKFLAAGGTIQDVINQSVPPETAHEIVDVSQIPSDRYFRNAWQNVNSQIVVDLPKARTIKLAKLLELRDQKLTGLDAQYLQALEENDIPGQAQIAAQKQALRNLPQTINLNNINDVDELKNFLPAILE